MDVDGEDNDWTSGRVKAEVRRRYSGRSIASDEGGGAIYLSVTSVLRLPVGDRGWE